MLSPLLLLGLLLVVSGARWVVSLLAKSLLQQPPAKSSREEDLQVEVLSDADQPAMSQQLLFAEPELEPEPEPEPESDTISRPTETPQSQLCHHSCRTKLSWLASFNPGKARQRMQSLLLTYLMVAYVSLVSTAMTPLGCVNQYGRSIMAVDQSIECDWCTGTRDVETSYGALYIMSICFTIIYGVGVPSMFFCIMFRHRRSLKHRAYVEKFGFLSTKMREQFYCAPFATLWHSYALLCFLLLYVSSANCCYYLSSFSMRLQGGRS